MGDRKPFHFLRHLRSLASDVPAYLLHTIWTSWLPRNVQTTLAAQPHVELDTAVRYADPRLSPHLAIFPQLKAVVVTSRTRRLAELLPKVLDTGLYTCVIYRRKRITVRSSGGIIRLH
jgi:hypothetical protein